MLDLSQHRVMTRAVFPNLLQRLIQVLKLTYTLTITSTMVNVSNAASYYQTKLSIQLILDACARNLHANCTA